MVPRFVSAGLFSWRGRMQSDSQTLLRRSDVTLAAEIRVKTGQAQICEMVKRLSCLFVLSTLRPYPPKIFGPKSPFRVQVIWVSTRLSRDLVVFLAWSFR